MKKTTVVTILSFLIIIIIILFGVGFWKWKSQQNQKAYQGDQAQNQEQQPINSQPKPRQIPEDQLVWYEIPELGVRFPVKREIRDDLIYSFNISQKYKRKAAAFSLESIKNNGESCSAERGPLGGIYRIDGQFKQGDIVYGCIGGFLVKQFDNFFVCFSGPQAPSGCFKNLENDVLDINKYMSLDKIENL